MFRTPSFYAVLASLLFLLAGCAVQIDVPVSGEPDRALQQRLAGLQRWTLDGKLAVRTPQQAESARIQWQQDGEAFDIRLSGPVGLRPARIYGMPGGVRFEQGDRQESAGSAESLSARLIGWPLPADQLSWWLRGLPASSSRTTAITYTPEGWLAALEQDGWQIRFSQHQSNGDLVLPGKIEASRDETRITLVIKQWQLP